MTQPKMKTPSSSKSFPSIWNCPQYITPRYTAEGEIAIAPLKQRIAELKASIKPGK